MVRTTAILGVAAVLAVVFLWAARSAFARRGRPGAVAFGGLAVSLSALTVAVAVEIRIGPGVPLLYYAWVLASLFWTAFVLEYTGRGPAATWRVMAGLFGFGGVVATLHALFLFVYEVTSPLGILLTLSTLTVLSFVAFGVFLVVRSAVTYGEIPRRRAAVLAGIGTGLVAILFVATTLEEQLAMPELVAPVSIGVLAATGALCAIAGADEELFEAGPIAGLLARERVLEEMAEPVFVCDREGRLVDSNAAARRRFEIDPATAAGRPLSELLGVEVTDDIQHQDGIERPDEESESVTLDTRDGRREFDLRRSTLAAGGDEPVGAVWLLRDVTDRRTHEQQLDVLNRVLRHNLRNDLDAIRGFAEPIRDGTVDDATVPELAERIEATAADVAALGTNVARAEPILDRGRDDREPVDLVQLADAIAEEQSEIADGTVLVSAAAPSIELLTDRYLLRTVLEELVENALRHHDSPDPRAEIRIDRSDEAVAIEVRDTGPGIPDRERAVLLEGEETPLRHGSGLGLWLVYWGTRRLGGSIAFAENDPRGSVVTLRLPVDPV